MASTSAEKLPKPITIVSWNVNGLQTIDITKTLEQFDQPTILALQETKMSRKRLATLDKSQFCPPNYSSYFSFSKNVLGYSGVATYVRDHWTPSQAGEGLAGEPNVFCDLINVDMTKEETAFAQLAFNEGRCVITQQLVQLPDKTFKHLFVINVYCPRLRDEPDDTKNNRDYKLAFHKILHRRAKKIVEEGSFVVVLGDMNITHQWLDQSVDDKKNFVKTEFRALLDEFLDERDPYSFVDTYRLFHPYEEGAFTCWNVKLNARENNYGSRLDYIFVDRELAKFVVAAKIHPDVMSSDHCPVSLTLRNLTMRQIQPRPPAFATKRRFPELDQPTIKSFVFIKTEDCKSEENSGEQKEDCNAKNKKRPLEHDPETKSQPNKRVQTELRNFFTTLSSIKKESVAESSTPAPPQTQEVELRNFFTTLSSVKKESVAESSTPAPPQTQEVRNYFTTVSSIKKESVAESSTPAPPQTQEVLLRNFFRTLSSVKKESVAESSTPAPPQTQEVELRNYFTTLSSIKKESVAESSTPAPPQTQEVRNYFTTVSSIKKESVAESSTPAPPQTQEVLLRNFFTTLSSVKKESVAESSTPAPPQTQEVRNYFTTLSSVKKESVAESSTPAPPQIQEVESQLRSVQKLETNSTAWKELMKPPEIPLCQGHKEPCARRTAKKKGINFGREFWCCSRGIGRSDDPNANCNFFQWVKSGSTTKPK